MIEYQRHERVPVSTTEEEELKQVNALAQRLVGHLGADAETIAALHIHGAQSKAIQDRVGNLLEEQIGFSSELVVMRVGTTANNHDLKDLWKAHISVNANHLFLVVPNELFSESGAIREKPFPKVVRRMGAFFTSPRSCRSSAGSNRTVCS